VVTIRPWLLIGKYRETLDGDLLARAGVSALLHLAARVEPPGITTLYLLIEDGEPIEEVTLRRGVDFVLAQRAAGKTVLVACGAGISRSTTFAIAALKEAESLPLLAAARDVRRHHPDGLPHIALWSSLCMHYQEPHDYLALVRTAEPEANL
jgi:protein-tyrosine phosphatase